MPRRFFAFGFLIFFCISFSLRAQTFASLKPNITQTLIDLGAQNQIVGLTRFCPKPNAKAKVVADYQNIDVEGLVRVQPDYILLSPENTQKKQFEELHMAFDGTRTQIVLLNFETLRDFFASYLKIAGLLQKTEIAKTQIKTWQNQLQEALAAHPKLLQKTFAIIVQREPLIVATGHTYLSSLLTALGLKNAFEKNQIAYPTLNPESLLEIQPDFLFDMSHNASQHPTFLEQPVRAIQIEDFLAHPSSLTNALQLFETLDSKPPTSMVD